MNIYNYGDIPILSFFKNFYKSFFDWDGFFNAKFIGFDNHVRLFNDQVAKNAAKNTFRLMFLACMIQVGLGLLFAILVDKIEVGSKFFRTVFSFPVVISATAIGLMFKLFYLYDGGLLNILFTSQDRKGACDMSIRNESHDGRIGANTVVVYRLLPYYLTHIDYQNTGRII